jgi:FecR protein
MPSETLERTILRLLLRRIWAALAVVLIFCFSSSGNAAQIKKARSSSTSRSVTTQSVAGARGSAVLNRTIRDNTTVRTDGRSRTELTFADHSIARLWAHTILDVKDGGRNLFLREGALFVDVPMGPALTSVRGADVAVDVTGTSALFEYHPKVFKLLVLNGTARLYRPSQVGDSVLVNAGQLVFGNPNAALSDPVDFDIKHFLKTSRFISGFPPVRNQGLIASEIQKQELEKSKKVLIETNLAMYGGGTTVSAIGRPPGKDSPTPGSTRGPGP